MKRTLFSIILIFLIKTSVPAQVSRGTITGKITDAQRQPLSNANILLIETGLTTVSDERGNFQLRVSAGSHTVQVSSLGYRSQTRSLTVKPKGTTALVISLVADEDQLEEVVISGQKVQTASATRTRTQIQDIPQAISIAGQRIIKQQAAFDMTTLTRNMTGINFTGNYSGGGSSQFFNARGFDLNETQNYRWNGVMISNWGNQYADNIEQVEFLKGPNSILFGDVAPGGVLNFVTKKPLAEFSATVNLKTGSWGLLRPALDITGPLSNDHRLRYRLNTSYERKDSFRDHVSSTFKFAAPALSWDISPKMTLHLEAILKSSTATDDAGLVSPDGAITGLRSLRPSLYLAEPSRKYLFKDQSYFATLDYEFNANWRIKGRAFHSINQNRPFGIWFDQPDDQGEYIRRAYGFFRRAQNNTIAADATGTFFTGAVKHQLLFGMEYQRSRSRHTNGGELDSLDVNNINAPVYGRTDADPAKSPFLPYVMLIERAGLHLQDQLNLMNDRLHVLLGLRAGSTAQGNRYLRRETAGTSYEGLPDDIVKKFVFSPRIGLVYKPTRQYALYATFTKGYEINSPDIFAKNYLEFSAPPATISRQTEVGVKSNLMENQLGISLALYTISKNNPYGYVYLNPDNPNYDEYNVYYEGKHSSRGAEMEIDGKPWPFLSVNAGFALTFARVDYDPGYPKGNLLPNAPKFAANCWINFEDQQILKGWNFGTGLFYKGKFYSSIVNDPDLRIPSAYTWDAAAGYQLGQAGVQVNVMNITNQVSYLNPWQFNLFDVQPLRQFVVTLSYKFRK
jgi:iron complex outermembrane recepter protein